MTEKASRRKELTQVLARFPEWSRPIRELFLRDESFRALCEDYVLARETLTRFELLSDAGQRPEVPDYRSLISELEKEIAALLSDPLHGRQLSGSANQKQKAARRPE